MTLSSSSIILAACVLLTLAGNAQTVSRSTLGMAGSSQIVKTNDHSYFVSQSIGQSSVIGTFTSKGKVLRQGFQQPPGKLHTTRIEKSEIKAVIYPNPTEQLLNIRLMDLSLTNFNIQLMDYMGKLLFEKRYDEVMPITVDLSEFSTGVYLLRILSRDKYLYKAVIRQ